MTDNLDTGLTSLIALAETNGRIRYLLNALCDGTISKEWAKERLAEIDKENDKIIEKRRNQT